LSSVSAEEQETSQSIRRHSLSLCVLFVCVTFVIRATKLSSTSTTIQTYQSKQYRLTSKKEALTKPNLSKR
jgi:hypothetical protein